MAVQSKTLVNDLGSAVVDELASQLNRAVVVTPPKVLEMPADSAGSASVNPGDTVVANGQEGSGFLFYAAEDCMVTDIKLMSIGAALNAGVPATSSLIVMRVPATWTTATGGGSGTAGNNQLIGAGVVHGDAGGTALGASPSSCELLFCTDGTALTPANECDEGQWFSLSSVTGAGSAAANEYTGTLIAVAHAETSAKNFSSSGVALNAGDTLVWGLSNTTGASIALCASISYRPVKDQLSLSPSFTPKGFHSKGR